MAAWWAAGTRSRSPGRGRVAAVGALSDQASGDGYHGHILPDLGISGLDTGGILGAFHGYADQTIISIIEDSSPAESKSSLDEESEATLLTALTEILDMVDDENPSPFDTLPDTELFSSPKDVPDSLLGVERHSWASFPDAAKDLFICLEPAIPRGPVRCSERTIKGSFGQESSLHDAGDADGSLDTSLGPQPEAQPDDMGLDDSMEPEAELIGVGLEDDAGLVFDQSLPCVINVSNVSLPELVRYVHPYCLPAEHHTIQLDVQIVQDAELETGRAAIQCEGQEVDAVPLVAGELAPETLPGLHGVGTVVETGSGTTSGPSIVPTAPQQGDAPARRRRGRPRKVAGLAVAGVTRGPATAPLTRSARRAQLLVTAGEGPAHGRPQTEPPPNTAQGGPIRGRALSRGRGRRGVMSKRPPGAGTPTQGGSGAGDPSPCKEAVVVPEPLPAQAVQPALISSSTIQPPPASDTLATIPSPALQPPPISDPLPTNPSPAPQPPPTSDPLPTNPSPASQPPPISDPPPTNPSPALQPPPISDPPPTNPSPAPQPPPISATLPTNPSPALQPPPTSDPLASPEAPQELSPTLEEAERSAVTPTLTLDHPPGVATPALSAATPAAAPGPVTQPPAAPPSGEHRQRPISLQQYRQRLQQRQQGEASPASRVPRPGSRPPAHAWPVVPIHSIVQGELSILPLDSVMTGDRSVPPATRQGSGPALPWGQTPIVTTPATRHVPPTHPHCQPPAVSCPHPAPTTAALPTHALPPSPPHTPVHSSRVRATSLELSPALTHPVPALAHPATALTHPALTHPSLPHPALPHPTLPPPLLHPTAALPLCHPVASTPLPYSAPTLPLPNPVPALPLPRTVPHLAPTLSYPTTALPRSHPPPTLGCLGHPLTARSPSVGPSPRPLGAAVPAPPSGVLPPPALGGRRSLLTQADPIPAPKGPAPSLGPKAPPPRPTATQQRCSRAAARETSRSRAAAMQKIAAISGVEGIEAADLMSLLEQFEVTEVRKEPSVLSTGTEPAAGRRFADQVFGAELASTAGLTPPATPPHQYWISPPPTVTAGDAHPGGSAEIAPASPPPLGWLIQPAKCVGPPTPPSDPRSSPTLLTDPRTKPTSPSHPRTKPILTSDSRNKPNLPSDPRIMPSYPRPSPTLPYDPIASLTLPSDPSTSPIPSPDPRTSSSMPYDLSAPPSDLRFPPSDPSLVPTPAPCFDHQYCLPCGVRKTLSPSALAPSSLPPTSLPPSALPDVGCRWNVRRQHGITIKPITLLSRRATEASDRVMTAEAPSPRGPASGPVAGVDTTPCSRLDPGPIPPGSAQHGQKTSLESPQQSPQTHVSPCYSRDCSTSSSSGSSSRSRSRSPAQKRRRYCRRRSRRSRHSSRSDSRSSSRSRSYSRSSSWSTSASRSRSRSRSPQSCSVRMSYFEELEPFEDSRHRYRTSRHQAVEHKISRSRELAIEERRVVYVGKIRNGMKREELRRRFEVFGEIEDCNIYFRTQGDNYGFVTFRYTCDAFAAIENGQTVRRPDEMPFDLCFGGRRQFCKTNYADLDSNHSEVGPYSSKSKFDSLDFDTLLKQAKRSARR